MNEVKLLNIGGIDQNVKDQYARDIIAPSENGLDSTSNLPVASRHYDAGEFLIGQDRLYYEALVEINVGDTLVVNSNIKATTVSDELVSLRNKSADSALEAIAYVENGVTSTRAYSIGSYLYWNYGLSAGLYKAKVAISPSDALVVDTNIEAVPNIGSQIEILTNQIATLTNEVETRAALGAHNFWKSSAVSEIKDSGNAVFTVGSDGIINVKTTNAVGSDFVYYLNYSEVLSEPIPVGEYTLTGCPSGGTDSTYYISFVMTFENGTALQKKEYGNGETFTITSPIKKLNTYFVVKAGTSFNNVKIKPMLALSTDPYKAYTPYAMTNRELTEGAVKYKEVTITYPSPVTIQPNNAARFWINNDAELYNSKLVGVELINSNIGVDIVALSIIGITKDPTISRICLPIFNNGATYKELSSVTLRIYYI